MSYRVFLSRSHGLGIVALSGVVGWPDLAAAMRALYRHPAWAPSFDVLWDGRAIGSIDIAPSELPAIRAFIEAMGPSRSGGRSAAVVEDGEGVELAMLFSRFGARSGRVVETFDALDPALAFLGLEAMPTDAEIVPPL